MKKFLKLCLAVAALATMFGFASCSNGSSDDSTAAATANTSVSDGSTAATLTAADYKGKTFASSDGKSVFSFLSETEIFYGAQAEESSKNKFKFLTYSVTDGKATVGEQTASLSETTLTVRSGAKSDTYTQISGSNGFGGKAFISTDKKDFSAFISDSKVFIGHDKGDSSSVRYAVESVDYTVSNSTSSWTTFGQAFTGTISDNVLTEAAGTKGKFTLNLVK